MSATFHSVLREAAGLGGFTLAQLTTSATTQFRTFINRRVREQFQFAWWSEAMASEVRYYRPVYAATTTYAADDEVYYDGRYYTALAATTNNLPTLTDYWSPVTELDAYILREQPGLDPIGAVRLVSRDDPRTTRDPRPVPFRLIGDCLQILGEDVLSSVYVWYRAPAATFLGDNFSTEATYTAGAIVYFTGTEFSDYEGDFWECLSATNAGESPLTTPAKWSLVAFPEWLRASVAAAAYADWLRHDGNPEVARLEEAEAQRLLLQAFHRDVPAQRQTTRSAGV